MRKWVVLCTLCLSFSLLVGCAGNPEPMLTLRADSTKNRQLQTKRFETNDEASVLTACAALLQDLGFKVDESEPSIGLITGSKRRSAKSAGNIALSVVLSLLVQRSVPYDSEQVMRAFILTRPVEGDRKSQVVRVTFHRIVYDSEKKTSKIEELQETEMYQTFFEKLSKALFLEAHDI